MEQLLIIALLFSAGYGFALFTRKPEVSKFIHLENLDADSLRLEIASMSIEQKEAMLDDILQYGQQTENNLRVAIVIQQYIIQDLKPNIIL